jgi:hypothetical protein
MFYVIKQEKIIVIFFFLSKEKTTFLEYQRKQGEDYISKSIFSFQTKNSMQIPSSKLTIASALFFFLVHKKREGRRKKKNVSATRQSPNKKKEGEAGNNVHSSIDIFLFYSLSILVLMMTSIRHCMA